MTYEYKVIPFLGRRRGSSSADNVSGQLESTINSGARDGWEFCQLGDVNIEVSPGCIASLFGAQVSYMRLDQLIFRRPMEQQAQVVAQPQFKERAQTLRREEIPRPEQQIGTTRAASGVSKGLSVEAMAALRKAEDKGYDVEFSSDKNSVTVARDGWHTTFYSEAEIIKFGRDMR